MTDGAKDFFDMNYFIKKFTSLTVPAYDIGYNYHPSSLSVEKRARKGARLLESKAWDKVREITYEISA